MTYDVTFYKFWLRVNCVALLRLEPVITSEANCSYIWSQLLHLGPIITFVASTVRPSVSKSTVCLPLFSAMRLRTCSNSWRRTKCVYLFCNLGKESLSCFSPIGNYRIFNSAHQRHTPFYLTPNNLPSGIILEIQHRDLLLVIIVLTMAKFKRNLQERFGKNCQWSFKVSKYNINEEVLKITANYVPQDLTKWYSGLKWAL